MLSTDIARLRRDAGLSLRAAARAIGVTAPAVQAWERGDYSPTARNVRRIEAAFNVRRGALPNNEGGAR